MPAVPLKKEFDFYLRHQDEFVEKHNGKVLVIKGQKVIGVYDDHLQALTETQKEHEPGTFMVQRCSPGPDDYSATYHSRVAFA